MRSYTAAEFVSRLTANTLIDQSAINLFGLVKQNDTDQSAILFSSSTACTEWLPIPVSMIESVQHLRNVVCKDHTHAFVRIVLVEPEQDDAAFVFMKLLAQANAAEARARARAAAKHISTAQARTECIIFHGMEGYYICCPPLGGGGSAWECTGMV